MPERKPCRQRIIPISRELLEAVLRLPDGTRIVDVSNHLFFDRDQFALKVENDAWMPINEGEAIPTICPLYHQVERIIDASLDREIIMTLDADAPVILARAKS